VTGRIVLIEDDPDIAALVEEMLRESGHQVDVRTNLDDGVADTEASVVITDLLAVRAYDPVVARQWISLVRSRFPGAKVIVSTAHAPAAATGAAFLGADAILTKPFDLGVFIKTVDALLGA
jgi:DNA-binding response OmpR family regulator